ncbi:GntR family transcriptional regulator [Roseobacter litoralis]|uniref:HTH-type transcriptional regulator, GntR family n=1 Tax=Roseobacter litoralis (strain ATCC 49566 / DSM 6996 / JCM 21268 / NBRC 15278 / OCh 149) TaxID=391595 RepID=F7ZD03_ROSLO|nr:GntR family transcriptional regulator [Roseobacter litoralis]AEI95764.1 HTH-type transcriptional regulator, GntR family [Roseobacter litoralis Och 149]
MFDRDIYTDLQHRLITNDFDHGEKLRAEQMKRDYGCSASTVREALFRLSTEGLVDFQEQRGFRVPEKSAAVLAELTHIRILLEGEGTVLSIRQGGVAWEARLTAVHHQLSHIEKRIHASDDPSDLVPLWFQAELEFHQTLISACESATLKAMHVQVYRRFRQQLMIADRSFDFISKNIQHHHAIMVAALDGNEDLTRQKIHDHLARHLGGAFSAQDIQRSKSSAM